MSGRAVKLTGARSILSKALGGACVGGSRIPGQPCVYVQEHELGCQASVDSACAPEEISLERLECEQGCMFGQKISRSSSSSAQHAPMV